jgi:hypothetical protein
VDQQAFVAPSELFTSRLFRKAPRVLLPFSTPRCRAVGFRRSALEALTLFDVLRFDVARGLREGDGLSPSTLGGISGEFSSFVPLPPAVRNENVRKPELIFTARTPENAEERGGPSTLQAPAHFSWGLTTPRLEWRIARAVPPKLCVCSLRHKPCSAFSRSLRSLE